MKRTLTINNKDGTVSEYNFFDKSIKSVELLAFFCEAYINEVKSGEPPPSTILTKEFSSAISSTEIPNNSTTGNRNRGSSTGISSNSTNNSTTESRGSYGS